MFENTQLAELAVGRSSIRQRILALLMAEETTRLHLRAIQRRAGTSPGTASRELARLVAAGLVEREAEGNQVYFRVSQSPIAAMMRQLLITRPEIAPAAAPPRIARARRAASPTGPANANETGTPATPAPASPEDDSTEAGSWTTPPEMDASGSRETHSADVVPTAGPRDRAPGASESVYPAPPAARPAPLPDPLALVVAARFTAAVRPLYETRLKAVFLYGARTSSPAPEDADVELLVVLDEVEQYGDELERTSSICAQLSLELGLVVSRVFVAESQWTDPGPGFVAVVPRGEATP